MTFVILLSFIKMPTDSNILSDQSLFLINQKASNFLFFLILNFFNTLILRSNIIKLFDQMVQNNLFP